MNPRESWGGIIHSYQKYDPLRFPPPSAPPPDLAGAAMEHLLFYGSTRQLTPEELARAVEIDPTQIRGLGPSLDAIRAMLEERKRKILANYETDTVQESARKAYHQAADKIDPPKSIEARFRKAIAREHLHELDLLFYAIGNDRDVFAEKLVPLSARLSEKYQVEELAAKYDFTGRQSMTVPQALDIKEELETIDKLLQQIEEASKTARIGVIDMEELSEFIDAGQLDDLRALHQQINDHLRELAEQQGITQDRHGFQLTPKAYRLFQSRLLQTIFSDLRDSRTGRHPQEVLGDGATELQRTKPYEFGDSVTHMDIPATMVNAMLRQGAQLPVRLKPEDIEIHQTRRNPQCSTVVLLDMSGSMRYDAQYVNVKRMGLALDGLIRTEFPGDRLSFIEMYTFAKICPIADLPKLMPKPVTIYNPIVRLKADMSDPNISELEIPPHFTNIQRAMQLGRQLLTASNTPNRQMVIITDGLPTAHFEGKYLYLLYPADHRTENATMREALLCAREGITINIFLLQTWNQSEEDVRFAYRMAEATKGRVVFTAGRDLDRFVVWDYVKMRRSIVA